LAGVLLGVVEPAPKAPVAQTVAVVTTTARVARSAGPLVRLRSIVFTSSRVRIN
jgi:hypothetical protein